MNNAISVRNITKSYTEGAAGTLALEMVNLDVRRGELMLLMGPSGSGKTTLLSLMGCILLPSSGNVFLGDENVTGMDKKTLPSIRLQHIGFVFQGFNLFPTLTAGENVELSLKLKGHRSKAAK